MFQFIFNLTSAITQGRCCSSKAAVCFRLIFRHLKFAEKFSFDPGLRAGGNICKLGFWARLAQR
jgi:hypothetical protein